MSDPTYKLGVAGAGKMGGALIRALVAGDMLKPEAIIAADISEDARNRLAEDCPGVTVIEDVARVAAEAQVMLIAVKPQVFEAALSSAAGSRADGQLIVSIMAGVPISRIAAIFPGSTPVIRAMPNVCCEVSQGAFGYAVNEFVTDAQKALVDEWFNSIGTAAELPEKLLDAVTGLSGSGPAFVAAFIEGLADGGVAAGLPRPIAQRLAAQTVLGAAQWVLDCGGPAVLKDMVCSPGGTTITGMRVLEESGLRSAAIEAVVAATERSKELGS